MIVTVCKANINSKVSCQGTSTGNGNGPQGLFKSSRHAVLKLSKRVSVLIIAQVIYRWWLCWVWGMITWQFRMSVDGEWKNPVNETVMGRGGNLWRSQIYLRGSILSSLNPVFRFFLNQPVSSELVHFISCSKEPTFYLCSSSLMCFCFLFCLISLLCVLCYLFSNFLNGMLIR